MNPLPPGGPGDSADVGVRVAPPLEALNLPQIPTPQGFMRRMARPTAGRIISTCLHPSVAAAPGPSWRTTSRPSTPSGILSALCAG
jgi:hypothetical protein